MVSVRVGSGLPCRPGVRLMMRLGTVPYIQIFIKGNNGNQTECNLQHSLTEAKLKHLDPHTLNAVGELDPDRRRGRHWGALADEVRGALAPFALRLPRTSPESPVSSYQGIILTRSW